MSKNKTGYVKFLFFILSIAIWMVVSGSINHVEAQETTWIVNTLTYGTCEFVGGPCSLGRALDLYQSGDTIRIEVHGTMSPTHRITIRRSVTIIGPPEKDFILTKPVNNNYTGIMRIQDNSNVVLTNLVFADGETDGATNGGAITLASGSLTINSSRFINNLNSSINPPDQLIAGGGAINANFMGTLTVNESEFIGNRVSSRYGGAIFANTPITINNSTFTNNENPLFIAANATITGSTFNGNRYDTLFITSGANVNVKNSTFSANTEGSAIYIIKKGSNTPIANVYNSTFVDNVYAPAPTHAAIGVKDAVVNVWGSLFINNDCRSGGGILAYNIYNQATGCSGAGTSNSSEIYNANILLGPLQDNGGPTKTHALAPNSPARDSFDCSHTQVAADQRGIARPQGSACDMGAYEYDGAIPSPTSTPLPAAPTPTPPAGGLVLHWALDEGSGSTANDASGNGNHGSLVNAPTYAADVPPQLASSSTHALSFDDTNRYVTFSSNQTIAGEFSVALWFKPNSTNGYMGLIGSRGPSEFSFDIQAANGNLIHGDIGNGSGWLNTSADASVSYQAGSWHHVAYVVSPTGYEIFFDGTSAASGALSGTPLLMDANHNLHVGFIGGYDEYFNGLIDDVRVYNRTLTAAEIGSLANPTSENGLFLHWQFNEGSGNTAVDASGSGRNGTLVNSPGYTTDTPTEGSSANSHALSFDGSGRYVSFTPNETVAGSFSVSAWVKPAVTTAGHMGVLGSRSPNEFSFDIQLANGNLIHGDIGNGSGWLNTTADATFTYQANTWYHLAYVVSPSGYEIFVNGSSVASGALSGQPLLMDANHTFYVGFIGGYNTYMNGAIDDVRVYTRPLTAAEVGSLAADAGGSNLGDDALGSGDPLDSSLAGTALGSGDPMDSSFIFSIGIVLLLVAGMGFLFWKKPWRKRYTAGTAKPK